MNKLTLTSLMLALAMAGCATTQTPPQQPVATVRGASEQQPAETVEDVPTAAHPLAA